VYVRTRFPVADRSDSLAGATVLSMFSDFATWFVVCTERGRWNFSKSIYP